MTLSHNNITVKQCTDYVHTYIYSYTPIISYEIIHMAYISYNI